VEIFLVISSCCGDSFIFAPNGTTFTLLLFIPKVAIALCAAQSEEKINNLDRAMHSRVKSLHLQ